MAKDKKPDKGKGKADDAKKGKAKKAPATRDGLGAPSEAPGGGDGWKLADKENVGKLLLFTPLREEETTVTRGKKRDDVKVIVADVVVIDEKKPATKSEAHEEVFVFGKWLQGSLRGYIGERRVLGRLGQDAGKSQGDRPAWVLEDPDDDDLKLYDAYIATADPFSFSSKEKAKAKGGKKSKKK